MPGNVRERRGLKHYCCVYRMWHVCINSTYVLIGEFIVL